MKNESFPSGVCVRTASANFAIYKKLCRNEGKMMKQMALFDWKAIKYYHWRVLLLPVISLAAGFVSAILVVPTNVFMFLFFSVNTFAVEEKGDLNKLYLTLPVRRSSVVGGRYVLSICMGLAGVLTGIPLAVLADRFTWSHYYGPIGWFLPVVTISYLLFSVFHLGMFPILFKLGYSKGKFWGMLLPLLLFEVLYSVWVIISSLPGNEYLLFNALKYASENMLLVNGSIILAATLILLFSFLLSKKLYSDREF